MTYTIEDDVPWPLPHSGTGKISEERATIRLLKPGQSFLAKPSKDVEQRTRQCASDESKGGKRYTCAKEKDGRIRCWRLT